MEIRDSIVIDAPVERVWEVFSGLLRPTRSGTRS